MRFEIKDRDGLGRIARWRIRGKEVETPNIAVVVNPNKNIIPPEEIAEEFEGEIIITNAYIIRNSPLRQQIMDKGIHKFFDWKGIVYTDSGTFQMYSAGKVSITNEETIDFQLAIGSDIITPLDLFTLPTDTQSQAQQKANETLKRINYIQKIKQEKQKEGEEIEYSFPIQGGRYLSLRRKIAKVSHTYDSAINAVGGIVPLMESYSFYDLIKIIAEVKLSSSLSKPLHAFGAGHPIVFPLLVLFGVDLFDSASYALYARGGRVITEWGTKDKKDVEYVDCDCPVCRKKSIKEMSEGELARHNLYMIFREIRGIKQAMKEHNLHEYVEQRISAHPQLIKAYRILRRRKLAHILSEYDNFTRRGGMRYVRGESKLRPMFLRVKELLMGREWEGKKVRVWGQEVPLTLTITFPFSQYEGLEKRKEFEEVVGYIKKHEKEFITNLLTYQFDIKEREVIIKELKVEYSKRTSRPKYILYRGKREGTIRARDNLLIPSIVLAKEILKAGGGKAVIVNKEAEEFVRRGASVMSKFIKEIRGNILPYEIIFILSEEEEVIAVGESMLNTREMRSFNHGVAVRNKRHV